MSELWVSAVGQQSVSGAERDTQFWRLEDWYNDDLVCKCTNKTIKCQKLSEGPSWELSALELGVPTGMAC